MTIDLGIKKFKSKHKRGTKYIGKYKPIQDYKDKVWKEYLKGKK